MQLDRQHSSVYSTLGYCWHHHMIASIPAYTLGYCWHHHTKNSVRSGLLTFPCQGRRYFTGLQLISIVIIIIIIHIIILILIMIITVLTSSIHHILCVSKTIFSTKIITTTIIIPKEPVCIAATRVDMIGIFQGCLVFRWLTAEYLWCLWLNFTDYTSGKLDKSGRDHRDHLSLSSKLNKKSEKC